MKTLRIAAASLAAAVMSTAVMGSISASAADYPEIVFGLTLVSDGGKEYSTADAVVEEGKELTFSAEPGEMMKSGDNGFQAATIDLKFDSASEYCTSVDDIDSFAFDITSLTFDGKDVLNPDKVSYTLADGEDGGFNINDSILSSAWVGDDDEALTINKVEVTIKVVDFVPKNAAPESSSEDPSPEDSSSEESDESSSRSDSTEKYDPNADGGGGASAALLISALAAGAILVTKRK